MHIARHSVDSNHARCHRYGSDDAWQQKIGLCGRG